MVGFLRNVTTAFKPSSIKQGLDAARNPPSQAEIDAAVATLPPEQRADYEAKMAEVRAGQAAAQEAYEQARAISDGVRVLDGPAGRYLYGTQLGDISSPVELQARIAEHGALDVVSELRAQRTGEFKQALRQTFNRDEVPQEKDPGERARIAASERAARDAARAPYTASSSGPIVMTRLATRGATQLEEVLAHLASSGLAARPDLVYGVYRVPDRISGPLTPHSEKSRIVEWDVVHAPLPPGAPPARVRAGRDVLPGLGEVGGAARGRTVGARRGRRAGLLPGGRHRAGPLPRPGPFLGVPLAGRHRRRGRR
jgi:hypothetical protein